MTLFAYGFRPFFLLAGLYGALALPVWLGLDAAGVDWTGDWAAVWWHGHEMIFGFAGAVLAGFLLTASAAWTGRPAIAGWRLGLLVGLWLAGRGAMVLAASLPGLLVGILDVAFLAVLGAALAPGLLASRQRRNLVLLVPLAALVAANGAVHLDVAGLTDGGAARGLAVAVLVIIFFIVVIGGRIVPSFTASAMAGRNLKLRNSTVLAVLSILAVLAVIVAEVAVPASPWSGAAALAAGVLVAARLAGWGTRHTTGQPILWILHAGYAWVAVGLVLKGLADGFDLMPAGAALHGLTAGAIGTMTMGMMSRVALGHTGRPLRVAPTVTVAYVLLTMAAAGRVASPFLADAEAAAVLVSGTLWSLAFGFFCMVYWPMLTRPRADGRPG